MGLLTLGLDGDVSWRRRTPEQRQITLDDFKGLRLDAPTSAGVVVTEKTALTFSAFWNGVDIISNDVAKLPRHLYARQADDSRERVRNNQVDRLLQQPNPYINDLDFWKTLMAHVLVWGNGYAEIEFDNAMRPIALWPLQPCDLEPRVGPTTIDGQPYTGLYYLWRLQKAIHPDDIFHVKGMGADGLRGYSVVCQARQSLGLSIAAERHGASFYGNGAWPGILLEHPGQLGEKAAVRLKESWNALMKGPDRAHSTAVLEEGMKANKIGMPADDAQFLQTREFQVVEVARWLNLPPHKLKHKMGERPGGNLTESELDYLSGTLDRWLIGIEQECNRKLISRALRTTQYVEHERDALLAMTPVTRAAVYKIYKDLGVMDEQLIAKKENLPKPKPKPVPPAPPAPPAAGDEGNPPPPPAPDNSRMLAADRANLVDAAARFVRREAAAARRAAKRGPEAFAGWAEQFYRDELPVLRGFLVPAVRLSLACRGLAGDAEDVSRGLATWYVARSSEELLGLPAKDLDASTDRLVSRWEASRAAELAERLLSMGPEEMRAAAPAAPVVHLTVNVPEQAAPTVNVEAHNHVPAAAPPEITVRTGDVNVPPQMPPEITVNVPATRPPDVNVTVEVPPAAPLRVDRDANGNITGLRP